MVDNVFAAVLLLMIGFPILRTMWGFVSDIRREIVVRERRLPRLAAREKVVVDRHQELCRALMEDRLARIDERAREQSFREKWRGVL